ncbi:hypothetical protein ACVJBD_001257 [Rhizobium mongolense]
MLALYTAAKTSDVPLIVQISANTDAPVADLPFLATKRRADDALASSGLPNVILRPAPVVGRNSHGRSALLRALASMPFGLPLIHSQSPVETRYQRCRCSRQRSSLRRNSHRKRYCTRIQRDAHALRNRETAPPMARPSARARHPIPAALAKPVTWLADIAGRLGWRSPLRSTAMAIMSKGVTCNGTVPAIRSGSVAATLAANPSGIQDLWFARLFLLKPLMVAGLALFWLLSGIIPLLSPQAASQHLLPFMPPAAAMALTLFTCAVDTRLVQHFFSGPSPAKSFSPCSPSPLPISQAQPCSNPHSGAIRWDLSSRSCSPAGDRLSACQPSSAGRSAKAGSPSRSSSTSLPAFSGCRSSGYRSGSAILHAQPPLLANSCRRSISGSTTSGSSAGFRPSWQ